MKQKEFLANNYLRSHSLGLDKNEGPKNLEKLLDVKLSAKMKGCLRSGNSELVKPINQKLIGAKRTFFDEQIGSLMDLSWKSVAFEKEELSILPKFIGIKGFLEHLKRRNDIWMVVRDDKQKPQVKSLLITPDQQKFLAPNAVDLDPETAIIVIKGNAKRGFDEFAKSAHKINPEKLQLSNAAVWMKENQAEASKGFPEKMLKKYSDGLQHPNMLETPGEFSIEHMFPDKFKNATASDKSISD